MTVRDSLIGLLAPQIGEARAIHLLNDFVVASTVGSRSSREEHRAEVLAEAARTPLVVRRFDCSVEPDIEDEGQELLICCVAEDGRPVALLLDDEARAKLAGLLGLGKDTGDGEPTPPRFTATPMQVDVHLRRILAEDVYLNYQRVIGNLAVAEAAKNARMDAALRQVEGEESMAEVIREVADFIDPRKSGGPYPAVLLCSQHHGFGACPGAPQCTPGGGR